MPQLQSPEIQAFANGFPIALMHIAVTVAILFVGVVIYVLMTPHREIAQIREGNSPAALSLGGVLVGQRDAHVPHVRDNTISSQRRQAQPRQRRA